MVSGILRTKIFIYKNETQNFYIFGYLWKLRKEIFFFTNIRTFNPHWFADVPRVHNLFYIGDVI